MKLNDIPKLMPVPFGVSGPRTELLESSPAGDRKASYKDGFPPITMLLKSAGGLPPDGGNMNQILFELASGQRWSNAGAGYKFNTTFSDAVGGYPKGAQLLSNDGTKVYVSTKDDNKTDFNASPGPDWVTLGDYIGLGNYATKTEVGLKLDKNSVVQSTGTSTVNVMSQKSVTDELNKKFDKTGGKITGQTDIEAPGGRTQTLKAKAGTSVYQELYLQDIFAAWWGITAGNKLSLENRITGNALTIGTDGFKIDGKNIATTEQLFGVGQAYKDVTASRKNSVRYQNTSTKPIVVCVEYNRTNASVDNAFSCALFVNDLRVDYRWTQANEIGVVSCIVPAGSYYEFKGGWGQSTEWESFVKWVEFS